MSTELKEQQIEIEEAAEDSSLQGDDNIESGESLVATVKENFSNAYASVRNFFTDIFAKVAPANNKFSGVDADADTNLFWKRNWLLAVILPASTALAGAAVGGLFYFGVIPVVVQAIAAAALTASSWAYVGTMFAAGLSFVANPIGAAVLVGLAAFALTSLVTWAVVRGSQKLANYGDLRFNRDGEELRGFMIEELSAQLDGAKAQIEALQETVKITGGAKLRAETQLSKGLGQLKAADLQIQALQTRNSELEEELDVTTSALNGLVGKDVKFQTAYQQEVEQLAQASAARARNSLFAAPSKQQQLEAEGEVVMAP